MLEAFFIFTKGGLVLFSSQLAPLSGDPVGALISTCLLEERAGEDVFSYGGEGAAYSVKWTFHNELQLVFVAVRPLSTRARAPAVARSARLGCSEAARVCLERARREAP